MTRRRIVVATSEPIADRMAGPAIRAVHIAEALAVEHDVHLVTTASCERQHTTFPTRHVDESAMREEERWMDVLVFQGGLLTIHPFLVDTPKVIVADVYDPFHLENLEPGPGATDADRFATTDHLNRVLNTQLDRADFLLAASSRQRDFWVGGLATRGRVNPATYDDSPTLDRLIGIVPFGLPTKAPVHRRPVLRGVVPGIADDDVILLWAGGVYNWFDPITLVQAVDLLRRRLPKVRLFFLGMVHPNPDIPTMRVAAELRRCSDALGLTGTHVFFNDGWVEYDDRSSYLLEVDVGVTVHHEHVETAYSFRTRVLDYLWAGLPIVTTGGDEFGDLVEHARLGRTVAAGDVAGLAEALWSLAGDPTELAACSVHSRAAAAQYRWDRVLEPLLEFCRAPTRAPDLIHPDRCSTAVPPVQAAATPKQRAARLLTRVKRRATVR